METSQKLFSILKNTVSEFDILDSFDRETVFSELIEFSKPFSSKEDVYKMYFEFNKYKKILHFLRVGDIVLAEYNFEYLTNKNITYSNEISKTCINSLYFPVVAYYYYKKKEFGKARLNLDKSYKEFDKLYDVGYTNVIFNFVEQKINEFRIAYFNNEVENAIFIAIDLFRNIFSKTNFYHFDSTFQNQCINDAEFYSYVQYVLDICNTYLLIQENRIKIFDDNAIDFIDKFNALIISKKGESFSDLSMNLHGVKLILLGNEKQFINFAVNNLELYINKNTPCSIAYILYRTFLKEIKSNESLYNESLSLLKFKEKKDSYKCFVEKVLQDERVEAKIF